MKISVSELRLFKKNASSVQSSNIIPIVSYLKFDNSTITKNALNSFVIQKIDCAESMLVDEKILMNFVDRTADKEISITKNGNRITISDSFTKVNSPTDDVSLFPVNASPNEKPITLTDKVIGAISVASKFTIDEDIQTIRSFVMVGKGFVASTDTTVGYAEEVGDVPTIILTKQMVSAITRFSEVDFSQNETYCFFDAGNCKYGFVKASLGFQFIPMFTKVEYQNNPRFTVNKKEIYDFNDLCVSNSKADLSIASINMNGNVYLESIESEYGIDANRKLDAVGKITKKFNYNTKKMNIILKNVSDEMLTFYEGKDHYHIVGETSGWTTLIMGMQ